MNSTIIYIPKTDRVPYFYIIQHIASGKFYAGSKYGKDANPSTFMQPDGYCTSSPTIKRIIELEGLEAFSIYRIMTETECGIDVYAYETQFLQENKIAQRADWFNSHNNMNRGRSLFGTEEFENIMITKYGVRNAFQSEIIKNVIKETNLAKYGTEYASSSPIVREKVKETNLERHGVECIFHSVDVKNKIKKSTLERFGFEHNSQSLEIKEKKKSTCMKNFGVSFSMQSDLVKEKAKITTMENFGVEHNSQSAEIKEKKKATTMKNFGVEHPMQSESVQAKSKAKNLANFGETCPAKVRCVCPHCEYETSLSSLPNHAKKCFPLHGEEWVKPTSPEEWKKYIKPKLN